MHRFFVALLVLVLVGCQTDGPRDSGGTLMSYSGQNYTAPYETDLNIAVLIKPMITSVKYRLRNNSIHQNIIRLAETKGTIFTERVDSFYSMNATYSMNSKQEFVTWLKKRSKDKYISHTPPQWFEHKKKTGGVNYSYVQSTTMGKCLYARGGYKLKLTHFGNDQGQYDTYFTFRYCDEDVAFEQFADLFGKVDVVDDRNAYSAAVKAMYGASAEANRAKVKSGRANSRSNIAFQNNLNFQKGEDAYRVREFMEAINYWKPLAEEGYVKAQVKLGDMYASGEGINKDSTQAIRWYQKAIDLGSGEAAFNLARMYETGQGVPIDKKKALEIYRISLNNEYIYAGPVVEMLEKELKK